MTLLIKPWKMCFNLQITYQYFFFPWVSVYSKKGKTHTWWTDLSSSKRTHGVKRSQVDLTSIRFPITNLNMDWRLVHRSQTVGHINKRESGSIPGCKFKCPTVRILDDRDSGRGENPRLHRKPFRKNPSLCKYTWSCRRTVRTPRSDRNKQSLHQ